MKNNFKQYDNVIRDLAKLNGTQAASYLLGTLDGALKRSIWQVRAGRAIRANRAVDSAPESHCDSTSLEMQKEKQ